MRNSTFDPLRQELDKLEARFGHLVPQMASEEHSRLVTTAWINLADAKEVFCDEGLASLKALQLGST